MQRDEWQLGCVISTLPDAVGIPPQSGSVRMSLSKLREALESHPTTSPTPSHMAHGCIPSTAVSTDCRPLYNALQPTFLVTGHCRGSTALQHSTALYSSTALQRSTVYILYNIPLASAGLSRLQRASAGLSRPQPASAGFSRLQPASRASRASAGLRGLTQPQAPASRMGPPSTEPSQQHHQLAV